MAERERVLEDREEQAERGEEHHAADDPHGGDPVSYTHLRAHETVLDLVCRLLLEKKKQSQHHNDDTTYNSNTSMLRLTVIVTHHNNSV